MLAVVLLLVLVLVGFLVVCMQSHQRHALQEEPPARYSAASGSSLVTSLCSLPLLLPPYGFAPQHLAGSKQAAKQHTHPQRTD